MSYVIDGDGKVTFTCNGCRKATTSRNVKSLPRGWYVVGVLQSAHDPECAENAKPDDLRAVGEVVGSHFHSLRCGKKAMTSSKVKEMIARSGVALALYGKCDLVIDGTQAGIAPGRTIEDDKRPKMPPPHKMEGGSPI